MKGKWSRWVIHVAGCLCFLTLPYIMRPGNFGEWGWFNDRRSVADLVAYLFLIGFFYLNFYWMIPRLLFTSKYALYSVAVVGCLLCITLVSDGLLESRSGAEPPRKMQEPEGWRNNEKRSEPPGRSYSGEEGFRKPPDFPNDRGGFNNHPPEKNRLGITEKISRYFFIFLAVFFLSVLLRIRLRLRQAEEERLAQELSYLKAQVNPHFLFNTLNSIYSLAIVKSDDTADAVVKLSGMMRYVLHDAANDFVPLEKELNYIQDYIELQKLRFGNSIDLNTEIRGNASGKRITPMLLGAFVENAFKHGVNAEEGSKISMEIDIRPEILQLKVYNKKVTISRTEPASGVGIQNARKRLAHLYPDRHRLIISDEKESFAVFLELTLL